ncbi:MarR family winged helix-turn-helix transcriptional regulator [Mucilaginibacter kameinonensis]|uniref:MarR family winged helix-turn-helix transcriptional regulator n=1 Tax=Mucilaginibacter kameinonensis TaxID=452286 RepID=UPI000EF8217D|nr:MarR family transcriptional regulator [Mucilaginibacter kameinonensis]
MDQNKINPVPPYMIAQIGMVSNRLRRECDKVFRDQDFPLEMDQLQVLLSLYYCGPSSQQEICYGLQRDKASVNRTIAFLLKNDMVKVEQDIDDKRKTRVELTEYGQKLSLQANAVLEKFDKALVAEFTEEEKILFDSLLKKLISIVTPM